MSKTEVSADAILDSLFDDIASGKVHYEGSECIVAMSPSEFCDNSDEPSTLRAKESNPIDDGNEKGQSDDTSATVDIAPLPKTAVSAPGSKRSGIKIGLLNEGTKSRIKSSSSDAINLQQKKPAKMAEEGEVIASDVGSDSEDTDAGEMNGNDLTDGELAESDKEKSGSKKKRKKKKKKKKDEHRRHKHKHKRRKRESEDGREKEKNLVKLENDSQREVKVVKEERPWKKMLDFHLNLNYRHDSRYRSRSPRRDRSREHSSFDYSHRSSCMYSNRKPSPFRGKQRDHGSSTYVEHHIRRHHRSRSPVDHRNRSGIGHFPSSSFGRSRHEHERSSQIRSPRRKQSTGDYPSTSNTGDRKSLVQKTKEDDDDEIIDKQKLYEIARRNAATMLKSGALEKHLSCMSTEDLMKLRSGGKSMEDLIEYCKKIQKKEKKEQGEGDSSSDDETKVENEDELDAFVRHPFVLKQQSTSFVFNVKNVTQIPVKTPAERAADDAKLRLTFPVSSGEDHRTNDPGWVPVSPPPTDKSTKSKNFSSKSSSTTVLALPPPPSPPALPMLPFQPPPPPPPPPQPPMEHEPIDIGDVVNTRLKALRRLNENANDVEAMKLLHIAEEQMKRWAESKNIPGLFTGDTGVQCLRPYQLAPTDPKFHAWARKDALINAKPVAGGVGMHLMQKMGWRPGEGLGKNNEGSLEPLLLEVKSDRKGLLAMEEGPSHKIRSSSVSQKDFQAKHPVSALMELCSKRKWGPPSFSCSEAGPSHDRRFTWKVIVNGVEYQTATPAGNKKSGKAQVCQVVLQSLGLIRRDNTLPIVIG